MPERPFVIAVLAVMSVVCLLLGLSYAIPDNPGPGDGLRAVCLIGFGLFALCAISLFRAGIVFPARLVFDNTRGWMTTRGVRGRIEGSVPYSGISGFTVRRTVADAVASWSVGIDLSRGGRWELYESRRKVRADEFVGELSRLVDLRAPVKERPAGEGDLTPVGSRDGVATFAWRRRTRPGTMIVAVLVVASFAAALFAVRPFADGVAASAVAAAFGVLLVLVTAAGIARTAGEKVTVEAGPRAITWRRSSALTREKGFSVPTADIASVDLSLTFARTQTAISLLRPSEVDQFIRYRQGTFGPGEVPAMLQLLRGLRRIDVSALAPGHRFALAEALREVVVGRNRMHNPS
jgi:hypothetical protein